MTKRNNNLLMLAATAFLLVATFAVYFQLSNHQFLIVDDTIYVTENHRIQSGLTFKNIIWAFSTLRAEFWHPVTWLSYMADVDLYGLHPGGFLLTNLFIHLLNVLLVFFLFRTMTRRIWESFLIAALFALHPLHVEAVAWIAERKELLCGFFWLLTLRFYLFYAQSPDVKRYAPVVLCFVLGIMSKTMIVTLPFTLLLLDFWPLKRASFFEKESLGKWVVLFGEKIPLFLISAAGAAVTYFAQRAGGGIASIETFPAGERIANAVVSYAEYIKKTLWPESLSVFYPVKEIAPASLVISGAILIGVTAVFLFGIKKYPFLIVGWLWFIGTLLPVIGIVKIGDFSMADRYTYIPLMGLFVIFAFSAGELIQKAPRKNFWRMVLTVTVLGCFIPMTYRQIKVWRNSETLFIHSATAVENNFFAWHALGEIYAGRGEMGRAVTGFARAVETAPDRAFLWIKLGRAYFAAGEVKKAVHSFERARQLAGDKAAPHFYLLCSYLAEQKMEKAREHFSALFEKNSDLVKQFEDQHFRKSTTHFERVLSRYGISLVFEDMQRLVIKGYDVWEKKHLRKGA